MGERTITVRGADPDTWEFLVTVAKEHGLTMPEMFELFASCFAKTKVERDAYIKKLEEERHLRIEKLKEKIHLNEDNLLK